MMNMSISKDNRGLTLLELIIGITILTIIAVPLLHSFVTSAATARKSEIYENATAAAENEIETIEATDLDDYIRSASINGDVYTIDKPVPM